MKTTIKRQIEAVNQARKELEMQWETGLPALNDAATTLAAVNLIGEEKILIASELIKEVKKLLKLWDANKPIYVFRLREILKRLTK